MSNFFATFHSALPLLSVIFISVLCLILLVRLALSLFIHFAVQKYKKLRNSSLFKKKDPKKFEKEEDELLRQIPKAHSATRAHKIGRQGISSQQDEYGLIKSEEQEREQDEMNEVKIVDMVKPIGFWTSVILGQKLTYLINSAQIINKRGKQGFWVSMIEAQEQAAGRQHSRGR